ncbi:uncharacterized protein MELLADRAFT_114196 [Melampsora larici-populina 98AG31]|uniref:Uncharacterized protein n=1 Tax=Melampsora larici-populina (strain 98AG31 / pathotype 3-4-7) TaxID=747676 RepID=F4SCK4_MELLP|nr:uncharacterized protein MELLADRAFT_114196 [Melampsora larici-populina 98AG31]EGF97625.1 hypothetical protein MELLADRAFT_114196 [Melampsora larici-populina 98AG31]
MSSVIVESWLCSVKPRMTDRLQESKEVLRSLLEHLTQSRSRLWIAWNVGMSKLLSRTLEYSQQPPEVEATLELQWKALAAKSRQSWVTPILDAEPHDVDEAAELEMPGDEDLEFEWWLDEMNEDDDEGIE